MVLSSLHDIRFLPSERGDKTKQGGVSDHAFNSSSDGPDRGWRSSLAHQPIHTNGGLHKVDPERRRGHCRCIVAPEHFRAYRFAFQDPRGQVTVYARRLWGIIPRGHINTDLSLMMCGMTIQMLQNNGQMNPVVSTALYGYDIYNNFGGVK